MTNREAAKLLAERQKMFAEQTKLISHIADKAFIDRVIKAYGLAIDALLRPESTQLANSLVYEPDGRSKVGP